jgi:hypothetical protein
MNNKKAFQKKKHMCKKYNSAIGEHRNEQTEKQRSKESASMNEPTEKYRTKNRSQ